MKSQFIANLALLNRTVATYAPEMSSLISWLHESVVGIVDDLKLIQAQSSIDDDAVRRAIALESVLIETNATLTLHCSQLASGTFPLLSAASFPVGEYSLLGIGSMVRSLWRFYSHLSNTFAQFNVAGTVKRQYPTTASFDPYGPLDRSNYSAWRNSHARISQLSQETADGGRLHIPYFSSRWGFHESMHSVSASWQCLHASASKEWNLLTLTHEFLHSHLREVLGVLTEDIPNAGELDRLLGFLNAHNQGETAMDSMRLAFVTALIQIDLTTQLALNITGRPLENRTEGAAAPITATALNNLIRTHSVLFHEIAAHVLDYLYIFEGKDTEYMDAVWSSWCLVPVVNARIDQYVLRSLCALAATADLESDNQTVFADVVERLSINLESFANRSRSRPAIRAAMALLQDETSRRRLGIQFVGGRYVVNLIRTFFFHGTLNAALIEDDLVSIGEAGRTYAMEVGRYDGSVITSPVGFLLDRFVASEAQAGQEGVEHASVWQMLQLI